MKIVRAIVAIMLLVAIVFFVIATYMRSTEVQLLCVKTMVGLLAGLVLADFCCKDSGFSSDDLEE